jgi:hypothetical protein
MSRLNPTIKRPIDAFPKCPSCLASCLKHRGIHVYCLVCKWDSVKAFADAGGYDDEPRQNSRIALRITCWPSSSALTLAM